MGYNASGTWSVRFEAQAVPDGNSWTVTLTGELDAASAPRFQEALSEAEQTDAELILIDAEQLTFIDSIGIEGLVAAKRRANARGCRLVIRNPTGDVERIFQLVGLDKLLRVNDD